jgi:hypothetical protein
MEYSTSGPSPPEDSTPSWEEPELEPINMSAEIGAYQDDFGEQTPVVVEGAGRDSDP